jgi:tetratricopeptide (TPR) repeat protein
LVILGTAGAEVKLRIYMRDGSLQSGTLVAENENAFVILARAGRLEVPKKDIMQINGKTLDQWQKKPDPTFQTEILPADIADPSFVTDKSNAVSGAATVPIPPRRPKTIPSLPAAKATPAPSPAATAIPSAPAEIKPVPARREPVKTVEKPTTPAATPPKSAAVETAVATPAAAPSAAAARENVLKKEVVKPRRDIAPKKEAAKPAKTEPKPASAHAKQAPPKAPAAAAAAPAPRNDSAPPASVPALARFGRGMDERAFRAQAAQFHRDRGEAFARDGLRGRAIQEFHFAALMDHRDPSLHLRLGELYVQEGNLDRARKILELPILKKSEKAASLLAALTASGKKRQQSAWILYGATGTALLSLWPLIAFSRRWTRRVPESPLYYNGPLEEETEEKEDDLFADKAPLAAPAPPAFSEAGLEPAAPPAMFTEPPPAPESAPAFEPPPLPEAPPAPRRDMEPEPRPVAEEPRVERRNAPREPESAFPLIIINPVAFEPPGPPETSVVAGEPPAARIEPPAPPTPPAPPVSVPPPAPVRAPEPVVRAAPPPEPVYDDVQNIYVQPPAPPAPAHSPVELEAAHILAAQREVDGRLHTGHALAADGKNEAARKEYRTALVLRPECAEAYLGLAYLSFVDGQLDLTAAFYERAATIDPLSADAEYGWGRALVEAGRADEAVPHLRRAAQLDPALVEAQEALTYLGKAD